MAVLPSARSTSVQARSQCCSNRASDIGPSAEEAKHIPKKPLDHSNPRLEVGEESAGATDAFPLVLFLLYSSHMSKPIVVRIQTLAEGSPVIEAVGTPLGHNIYVGPLVNTPAIEDGALINLFGVDPSGSIPDQGWRFLDPSLPPEANHSALAILWITHDYSGPFGNGDLQIGFNCARPGHHYANPMHTHDQSLGPVPQEWVTIYSDDALVLLFKFKSSREADPKPRLPLNL